MIKTINHLGWTSRTSFFATVLKPTIGPNKANAIKLVEFLLTPESQEHFVNNTFEFPMIGGVSANPLVVNNIGLDFKQDLKTKVSSYGAKQADALEVMTAAGWK